ncbi:hypothetical protein HK098_001348 [Nowakowskiella sp. JEL0407]|nr:hypothetical protein HK098_001348 [Nowakowskiella sp. JEL0407]
MNNYDVFISYRVKYDEKHAETLYNRFKFNQSKNTKVFWDKASLELGNKWKKEFLDALANSRIFIPILSNEFMDNLVVEKNKVDNVLLEWDTILERCENGSKQLIIPVFVDPFNFGNAGNSMKDIAAKDCKRTAKQIWDSFNEIQGRFMKMGIVSEEELFVLKVQDMYNGLFFNFLNGLNQNLFLRLVNLPPITRPMQYNLYESDDPDIFIDCAEVIREIDNQFKTANICNLMGLGGSGKTFVANKFAFLMLARGFVIAKFTADSVANLNAHFEKYLKRLLEVENLPATDGNVRDYLQLLTNAKPQKQFIILDNVTNLDHVEEFKHSKNKDIKFLITSRKFITNPLITKGFYSEEACVDYLRKETGRKFSDQLFKDIVEITNGFPLRLKMAARVLSNPHQKLQNYLADVKRKKAEMKYKFDPARESNDEYDELFPEVSLSVDILTQQVSCGDHYLALLSYVEPDFIVEKHLVAIAEQFRAFIPLDSNQIDASRQAALNLSIIEDAKTKSDSEDESTIAIKIHRCVQAEIRDRLKDTFLGSVVENIGKLYNARTKSYDTLCSELKAGKVEDSLILLQTWSKCELYVSYNKLSHGDLKILDQALAKNTSVKELRLVDLGGGK